MMEWVEVQVALESLARPFRRRRRRLVVIKSCSRRFGVVGVNDGCS